jgi:hypothetical protein
MATPVRRRQLGPFAVRSTEILIAEGGEEAPHAAALGGVSSRLQHRAALPLLVVPRRGETGER